MQKAKVLIVRDKRAQMFLQKDSNSNQIKSAIDNALLDKSVNQLSEENIHTKNPGYVFLYNNFFFVKHVKQFVRVNIDDILWVKADSGSVEIITPNLRIVTYASLSSFCRQIVHPNLIRIHRSYVINKHKVVAFNEGKVCIPHPDPKDGLNKISIGNTYQPTIQDHFPMLKAD